MSRFKRFILEVHHRSVWQVLGIYVVGSWVIWQVVGSMYEWIGLPEWVPGTALVILIAGLPLVVATAFVQEGGPGAADSEDAVHAETVPEDAVAGGSAAGDHGGRRARETPRSDGFPSSLFTWNRAITLGVLAFAVLGLAATGFMGMRALGIGPAATLISSGELEVRDRIVLADFTVTGPDTTFGELVTEALRIDLNESPVVTLAPEVQVRDALARMQRDPSARVDEESAREVALREGLNAVLSGEVREAAGSFVLTARLVTPDSARALGSFRATAPDSTRLINAIDELSEQIRTEIGESLKSVRETTPLQRVTTSSLTALRLYSRGQYDDAIAVDSTFAMAWRKISVQLGNDALQRSRQVQAATRAYELRDRLPPRERGLAVGTYHTDVTGDIGRAERALNTVIASYPDDHVARNNLGITATLGGDWDAAVRHFDRARAILPSSSVYWTNLGGAWRRAGQLDRAIATLDSAEARFPEYFRPPVYRATGLAGLGRYAEADSVMAALRARFPEVSPPSWYALEIEAENDAVRGRLDAALDHLDRRRWLARNVPPAFQEVMEPERLEMAATAARWRAGIAGDHRAARTMMHDALTLVPPDSLHRLDRPCGDLAEAFAYSGDPDAARMYIAAYESIAPGHWAWGEDQLGPVLRARGLIALQEGRPAEALQHFRQADQEVPPCHEACVLPLIGRAHEQADRPDSAIASYQRYLDLLDARGLGHDPILLTLTLQRLPQLYETRGDREAAARLYARFIELWKDADPELQPQVETARRALARLTAEGA